jgi:hypothetical protein
MRYSNSVDVLRWREIPVWLRSIAIVGIVNFAAFFCTDIYFGGSALNGYHRDNRFYIASHGHHTQVTERFWTFNYVHGVSTYVTHLAVFVGLAVFLNTRTSKIRKGESSIIGRST